MADLLPLVINQIEPEAVTLADPDGTMDDGRLYVDFSDQLNGGKLDPGESVSKRVAFDNPDRARFQAGVSVYGVVESLPGGAAPTFCIGDGCDDDIEPPTLIGSVSRKMHGGADEFDIDLPVGPASAAGVECRMGGPTRIVLTFSEPVQAADGVLDQTEVSLTCDDDPCGTVEPAVIVDHVMTIDMSGIPDATCLVVTLNGIADLGGNPLTGVNQVHIRVLAGDVDSDGNVTLTDYGKVKDNNGFQPPWGELQIRCDIDLDYDITLTDYGWVKDLNGHAVTCP